MRILNQLTGIKPPHLMLRQFLSTQKPPLRAWKKWILGGVASTGVAYVGYKLINDKNWSPVLIKWEKKIDFPQKAETAIPIKSTLWVGRSREIKEIETVLTDRSQSTAICLLNGIAGIGKTQLALRIREKYNQKDPNCSQYIDIQSLDEVKEKKLAVSSPNLKLLIIDNIASSKGFEEALNLVRQIIPEQALLVGSYSPINPSYFNVRMAQIELKGLSREEIEILMKEIQKLPESRRFTLDGIEKIQDANGSFHPGLFWSAAISSIDMGFVNIRESIDQLPAQAFSKHRPEYISMEERYQHLFFEELSDDEEKLVCVISRIEGQEKSFSLDDLKLHEETDILLVNQLIEKMILERFVHGGEVRYRWYDKNFFNFVKQRDLKPKSVWEFSSTYIPLFTITALALSCLGHLRPGR